MEGDVLDVGAEHLAVGNDDAAVVEGIDRRGEQADLGDDPEMAAHLDRVADLERPKHEQHDARGEVGERALEGEADGEARRADDGRERGGLHPEDAEAGEDDTGHDAPSNELTGLPEERPKNFASETSKVPLSSFLVTLLPSHEATRRPIHSSRRTPRTLTPHATTRGARLSVILVMVSWFMSYS